MKYLEAERPALLMFHGFAVRGEVLGLETSGAIEVDRALLREALQADLDPLYRNPPDTYQGHHWTNEVVASVVGLRFLVEQEAYRILYVRHASLTHVWGIHETSPVSFSQIKEWIAEGLRATRAPSFRETLACREVH